MHPRAPIDAKVDRSSGSSIGRHDRSLNLFNPVNAFRDLSAVQWSTIGYKGVGRYRERQYQLAAQKQNDNHQKYDYYQKIANYFERECQIAKHYDSWNYRSVDPKGELQKAKKAERLLARRNKLRTLLAEEDDTYRKELEQRKKVKSRPEESSLEYLRQKLKERRAEQSLYYPKTCRRYQSYFICPKESNSQRPSTLTDTNLQYNRVCRDSTNLLRQNPPTNSHRRISKMTDESYKTSQEQENLDTASASFDYDTERPTSKYSARYARRSLENTNVRNEGPSDCPANRTPSRSSFPYDLSHEGRTPSTPEIPLCGDNKENASRDHPGNRENVKAAGLPSSDYTDDWRNTPRHEDVPHQRDEVNGHLERPSVEQICESARRAESNAEKNEITDEQNMTRKDNRQFEVEKSLPWLRSNPGDKNLSKQMFMYLVHKELKCKIEDLSKRETHACNKQCWDEALRLRDMRNKYELIREKKLYSMEDLDLDEESRKMGLVNIDKREAELAERAKICMDSTMYSQDAKDMWKKWVKEDERCVIKDARQQRELLMSTLEKEWQNLAIRDKEKISHTYQSVLNDSALQEEHKLAGAINASRMKSLSS